MNDTIILSRRAVEVWKMWAVALDATELEKEIDAALKASPPQPVQSPRSKSFQELEYKVGWKRYEIVRRLNVQQFSELFERGLKGERFDEMVDEIGATP